MTQFLHPHNIALLNQALILLMMDIHKRRNTMSYDTEIKEFINESMPLDQQSSLNLDLAARGIELIKKAPRDTWSRDEQKAVATYEAMRKVEGGLVDPLENRRSALLRKTLEDFGYVVLVDAFLSAKAPSFDYSATHHCVGVYVDKVEQAIRMGQLLGTDVEGTGFGDIEVIYPYTSGLVVAFRTCTAQEQ